MNKIQCLLENVNDQKLIQEELGDLKRTIADI